MENLPTPLSRVELYLAKACGMDVTVPEQPLSRLEQFLAILAGDTSITMPTSASLTEQWLAYVLGVTPDPLLAVEGACLIGAQKVDVRYFARAAGMPGSPDIPEPQNRTEQYWYQIASNVPIVGFLKYATGIEMTLTDILSGIENLEFVYGDTTQQTYSGKNLCGVFTGYTSSGVTGTLNADGSLTISGKATETAGVRVFYVTMDLPAGTYTMTLSKALPFLINYSMPGAQFRFPAGTTKITSTLSSEITSASIFAAVTNDETYDETFNVQIVSGSTADYDFEPYTGGIPSPNPDYPQDVQVVTGGQTVTVTGKNLFNVTSKTRTTSRQNVKVTLADDGMVTLDGVATGGLWPDLVWGIGSNTVDHDTCRYYFPKNLEDATFSIKYVSGTASGGSVTIKFNDDAAVDVNIPFSSMDTTRTVQNVNGINRAYITQISSGVKFDNFSFYIQVEEGTSPTSFQPFQNEQYEVNLGKNLIYNHATDKSQNGVDMIMNADGTVTANGNGDGTAFFLLQTQQESEGFAPGTYTIKCHSTLAYGKIIIEGYAPSDLSTKIIDVRPAIGVTEATFTLTAPDTRLRLSVVVLDSSKAPHDFDNEIIGPFQLEVGSTATPYASYFDPIELCKIGNYQDYIYKSGDDWYLHKATTSFVIDGTKGNYYVTGDWYYVSFSNLGVTHVPDAVPYSSLFTYYTYQTLAGDHTLAGMAQSNSNFVVRNTHYSDAAGYRTWFANSLPKFYYPLATPTDTKITDATLISQLDALDSAVLPKPNANITVTASDPNLPGAIKISYYTRHG